MQKLTSWKDRYHNMHSFFARFVEQSFGVLSFWAQWELCEPCQPSAMLGFLLRRCGVYGLYFHNDEQRFVLSISVERDRDESDERNQNDPKQETLKENET